MLSDAMRLCHLDALWDKSQNAHQQSIIMCSSLPNNLDFNHSRNLPTQLKYLKMLILQHLFSLQVISLMQTFIFYSKLIFTQSDSIMVMGLQNYATQAHIMLTVFVFAALCVFLLVISHKYWHQTSKSSYIHETKHRFWLLLVDAAAGSANKMHIISGSIGWAKIMIWQN